MRSLSEANETLEQKAVKQCLVGSMDVEALYPSIHQKEGAKIVTEEIIRSDIKYQGVDVRKAAIHIAAMMEEGRQGAEGIRHLLPVKKAQGKSGRRPTVRSKELGGQLPRERKPETREKDEDMPCFEEGGGGD